MQPVREFVGGRESERDAAVFDRLLRSGDPTGHGLLGPEQGTGNLGGAKPADRPQRQSDLRGCRQRRVATQEQQNEGVVAVARTTLVHSGRAALGQCPSSDRVFSAATRLLGAQEVGEPARCDGDEPTPGVVGHPFSRPLQRSRSQRLLGGILRQVEVAVAADHRAEDLRRQAAQQVLDLGAVTGGRPSCSALEVRLMLVDRPHVRIGACPDVLGTGTAGEAGGDLGRPVEALALDDPVAGEYLLGFGVGAVGYHRGPLFELDPPSVHRSAQASGLDQLARVQQFLVERSHERPQRRPVLLRPRGLPRAARPSPGNAAVKRTSRSCTSLSVPFQSEAPDWRLPRRRRRRGRPTDTSAGQLVGNPLSLTGALSPSPRLVPVVGVARPRRYSIGKRWPKPGPFRPETPGCRGHKDQTAGLSEALGSAVKEHIFHLVQKSVLNPVLRLAFRVPLPDPGDTLLETKGRRTGQPRLTSVCDGGDGNVFWLLSQRGTRRGLVPQHRGQSLRSGQGAHPTWAGGEGRLTSWTTMTPGSRHFPGSAASPVSPVCPASPAPSYSFSSTVGSTVNGEHGANATLPVAQGTSLGPEPEPKPLRSSTPFTPPPTGRIRSGPVPSGPV